MAAQKVFLLSIDGWGLSSETKGNAIHHAHTPVMDSLMKKEGKCLEINASGLFVGLPENVMGNSEVGHLTMGAGRVLYQDLVRINKSIKEGTLAQNPALKGAFEAAKSRDSQLHFLGLLSDGGVHSHIDHLFELLRLAKEAGLGKVFVHGFLDGRDTPPDSGSKYVSQLLKFLNETKTGKLSTLVGRFYAMDRDNRWDRIEKAYGLMVRGEGEAVEHNEAKVVDLMRKRYAKKCVDETMEPISLLPAEEGKIKDGDVLVFIDYRSDRMRQIVPALSLQNTVADKFNPRPALKRLHAATMTQYSSSFNLPVLFPPYFVDNVLAKWVSDKGLRQLHVAETEKYAHVTFFFNGRTEKAMPLEDRILVPSPSVKTYDLAPEMSMPKVKDEVIKGMEQGYDFVMCNFAPPDMVGHTGNYEATVKACEATDRCVGECLAAAEAHGYVCLITADHGNAEEMLDEHGNPKTSHNCNLIPLCIVSPSSKRDFKLRGNADSSLQDVAPTVCAVMGLEVPKEMEGKSLLDE